MDTRYINVGPQNYSSFSCHMLTPNIESCRHVTVSITFLWISHEMGISASSMLFLGAIAFSCWFQDTIL